MSFKGLLLAKKEASMVKTSVAFVISLITALAVLYLNLEIPYVQEGKLKIGILRDSKRGKSLP